MTALRGIAFGSDNEALTKRSTTPPFLIAMSDGEENCLKIVLAAAKEGEAGEDLDELPDSFSDRLREMLARSVPLYPDEDEMYEIVFDNYIMYQTRNEVYTVLDKYEVQKGKFLVIMEKSRLLDWYSDVIADFDSEDVKAGRKHYGIYLEDHIIDVISNYPPVIQKI